MQNSFPTMRQFEEAIRSQGLRSTEVRKELFSILSTAKAPMSTQELTKKMTAGHFVSVYRSLNTLLKAGLIREVPYGFKNLYELGDAFKPHHHHATCEVCGKSKEIHDNRIESLMKELTREAGLKPTKHHFEMYGICQSCEQAGTNNHEK